MRHFQLRSRMWACGAVLLAAAWTGLQAQQVEFNNNIKFNAGQGIQPVFEGWSWAPDGSVNMHFGYLNRNWVEQLHIPVGPDNNITPGGPDRGQPTYFYTRTQRNQFTVNVPKDFGMREELVWTLTANGQTHRAHGWRQIEWEIDPVGGARGGGSTDKEYLANKWPTISIGPVSPVKLPGTATLTATVADDGLPKPRPRAKPAVGQEIPPTLNGGVEAPVNLPVLEREPPRRPDGLTVSWIVWRGPAEARFDPYYAQPADGKTTTTAVFTVPGDYVLQAAVDDGQKTTRENVSITVTGAPVSQP